MQNSHLIPGAPELARRILCPLSGWPVENAIVIDRAAPGFLAFCCDATAVWRQAFAAALAGGHLLDAPATFLERAVGEVVADDAPWSHLLTLVGQLLPVMTAEEIITAGLGECPAAFRGALSKIGIQPLTTAQAYVRLLDIFVSRDPVQRLRRRVLEQLSQLDDDRLQVVECIDPVFLAPDVISKVSSVHHAHHLNAQLAVIRRVCSSASDEALGQSVRAMKAPDFREWTRGWLGRADQGLPADYPWSGDAELVTVTPATAREVARSWRNCLGSPEKVGRLIGGTWAAVAWEARDVIATFVALEGGLWLLSGVYRRSNAPVTGSVREAVRAKFGATIGCVVPVLPAPDILALTGPIDFGQEFDLDELAD